MLFYVIYCYLVALCRNVGLSLSNAPCRYTTGILNPSTRLQHGNLAELCLQRLWTWQNASSLNLKSSVCVSSVKNLLPTTFGPVDLQNLKWLDRSWSYSVILANPNLGKTSVHSVTRNNFGTCHGWQTDETLPEFETRRLTLWQSLSYPAV